MVEGLPKGQPKAGDKGLDNTRGWGNTYWGGCRYWFIADIEIRKRTENRRRSTTRSAPSSTPAATARPTGP